MTVSASEPSINRQKDRTMCMTATTTPVLSFPAAVPSDTRSLKKDLQSVQTCAMDQTRILWVVSDVYQDFMNGVRPLLDDLGVESEESLSAAGVKASMSLRLERALIPPEDFRGTL